MKLNLIKEGLILLRKLQKEYLKIGLLLWGKPTWMPLDMTW